MARRADPPVTCTSVAGPPCSTANRPLADKNENAAWRRTKSARLAGGAVNTHYQRHQCAGMSQNATAALKKASSARHAHLIHSLDEPEPLCKLMWTGSAGSRGPILEGDDETVSGRLARVVSLAVSISRGGVPTPMKPPIIKVAPSGIREGG